MDRFRFTLELEVRDYECDMQGIVNNAVYQNYLEHARHVFLKSRGIDFSEFTARGIHLVVVRVELDYLRPLKSGDRFLVGVNTEKVSPLRFGFLQEIIRLSDGVPMLKAKVIGTTLNERGRPYLPPEIATIWEQG